MLLIHLTVPSWRVLIQTCKPTLLWQKRESEIIMKPLRTTFTHSPKQRRSMLVRHITPIDPHLSHLLLVPESSFLSVSWSLAQKRPWIPKATASSTHTHAHLFEWQRENKRRVIRLKHANRRIQGQDTMLFFGKNERGIDLDRVSSVVVRGIPLFGWYPTSRHPIETRAEIDQGHMTAPWEMSIVFWDHWQGLRPNQLKTEASLERMKWIWTIEDGVRIKWV